MLWNMSISSLFERFSRFISVILSRDCKYMRSWFAYLCYRVVLPSALVTVVRELCPPEVRLFCVVAVLSPLLFRTWSFALRAPEAPSGTATAP